MYKFLMVDDEDIIRAGIKGRIDWHSLGYEFLEPCADGREAMARIAECLPDVVMTDICMPFVDGIELSAFIAAHYPAITVIVLSGYEDFEYARASIRNKVYDYLLKPITAKELTEVLIHVSSKLDVDRAVADNDAEVRKVSSLAREMAHETVVRKILSGQGSLLERELLEETLGVAPADLYFACARLELAAPSEPEGFNLPDLVAHHVNAVLNPSGIGSMRDSLFAFDFGPVGSNSATVSLLFYDRSEERVRKLAEFLSRRLAECFVREGLTATAGVGRCHGSLEAVAISSAEAAIAAEYGMVYGDGLYRYDPLREEGSALSFTDDQLLERLKNAVRSASVEKTDALISELCHDVRHSKAPVRKLRADIRSVFSTVADTMFQTNDQDEIRVSYDDAELYSLPDRLRGVDQIERELQTLCHRAIAATIRAGASSAERKVHEFREYVSLHYNDRDLSISKVSGSLNLSPSYLSKMLKRHLDCSFVEYLTGYRVDRAKEMLVGSNRMTYEIAEAAGYPDARYFSSMFKRLTGHTPREFRENRRK